MHWLAWCPDDADRDDAAPYTTLSDGVRDADDVAVSHAEHAFEESAGEVGQAFKIIVIEVSDNGAESTSEFDISVEYAPIFSARRRVVP